MKIKKLWSLFCIAIMFVIPTLTVKAYFPNDPIVIVNNVKLSDEKVENSDVLEYSIKISPVKDNKKSKKIQKIQLTWKSSRAQQIERTYKWDGKSVITIKDKINITKGMQAGKWSLYSGKVYIKGEGWSECTSDILKYKKVSFIVSGTHADKKAPVIDTASMKLSKNKVLSNQLSKLSVKVTDNTKVGSVKFHWIMFEKGTYKTSIVTTRAKYNKSKKCYESNIKLGSKYVAAKISSIEAKDIYGLTKSVYNDYETSSKVAARMNKIKIAKKSSIFAKYFDEEWVVANVNNVELYVGQTQSKDEIYTGYPDRCVVFSDYLSHEIDEQIEIYRSTNKKTGFKKIGTLSGEYETKFYDYTAKPGNTYYYKTRICKYNGKKLSYKIYSPVVSVNFDNTQLECKVSINEQKQVVVTSTTDIYATYYEFYKSTDAASGYKKIATNMTAKYIDEDIEEGKTYYYKVKSVYYNKIKDRNENGLLSKESAKVDWSKVNQNDNDIVDEKIYGLDKVQNLNVNKKTENTDKISWSSVKNATKYVVEINRLDGINVASVDVRYTKCELNMLSPGVLYVYKVYAVNEEEDLFGESAEVNYAHITDRNTITRIKNVDKGVGVRINFRKLYFAKEYKVLRATSENGKYEVVETIEGNSYEYAYTDKNVKSGKTYYYKVVATVINDLGQKQDVKASEVKSIMVK